MSRLHLFTLIIPFVTLTGAAHADEAEEEKKKELLQQLAAFDGAVWYLHNEDRVEKGLRVTRPVAECHDLIDRLKALGVPPTQEIFSSPDGPFMFRKAPERCARYGAWLAMNDAFPAMARARTLSDRISGSTAGGAGTTMWSEEAATVAKACVAALDAAQARGAIMDVVIPSAPPEMTGAQTRTFCEEMSKRAGDLAKESAKADEAARKAAIERYAKFGAAGDRLEWLLTYSHNFMWRVKGCKATNDPKTLAKARVLTQWWKENDGTYRIRRLTFKGNKLVNDEEREFLLPERAHAFCRK